MSATRESSGVWDTKDRAEVIFPVIPREATELEYQQAMAEQLSHAEQNRWLRCIQTVRVMDRITARGIQMGLTA